MQRTKLAVVKDQPHVALVQQQLLLILFADKQDAALGLPELDRLRQTLAARTAAGLCV